MISTKICRTCLVEQPETEFFFKDKRHTLRHNVCRLCHNKRCNEHYHKNAGRNTARMRAHYHVMKHDAVWIENRYIKKKAKKYDLSVEDAREIWNTNTCVICGDVTPANKKPHEFLGFDHSHQTGKYRGLLCRQCNWMLGHAKDDPLILRKGADYLEKN